MWLAPPSLGGGGAMVERQRERQAMRGSLRAVATTAGDCEAREVEYCQRSGCKTGGPRIPARRTPDIAVSERVGGLQSVVRAGGGSVGGLQSVVRAGAGSVGGLQSVVRAG